MEYLGILFGEKSTSFFDIWSIIHFLSGFAIGSFLLDTFFPQHNPKKITIYFREKSFSFNLWLDILFVLGLAFLWERFEYLAENGYWGASLQTWLNGVEFLGNRLIADPLLVFLGYLYGRGLFFYVDSKKRRYRTVHLKNSFSSKIKILFGFSGVPERQYAEGVISFVRISLVLWLTVNVFVLENSTSLQELIFQ